jgi:hypothetical protein
MYVTWLIHEKQVGLHTYTHTYVHTYIDYIHSYIIHILNTYTCIHMYTNKPAYMHIYIHTRMYKYIGLHTYKHRDAYIGNKMDFFLIHTGSMWIERLME